MKTTNTTKQAESVAAPVRGVLQRACACGTHTPGGGECEACKKQHGLELQRAANGSKAVGDVAGIVREVLDSSGQPLDEATRVFMEPRFGQDFSGVRVHTDAKAADSATAVNAHAYTVGQDVVFGSGRYAPSTDKGRQLLAHELTHVVQQATGPVTGRPGPEGMIMSEPGDPFERQANGVASQVMSGMLVRSTLGQMPISPLVGRPPLQRVAVGPTSSHLGTPTPSTANSTQAVVSAGKLELPFDEAARVVNEALDIIGSGLTYVRRPPRLSDPRSVAARAPKVTETLQTYPTTIQRQTAAPSSGLARLHAGVVVSGQMCFDFLTGEASIKGWLWAGIGYDSPIIGWVGGFLFVEGPIFTHNFGKVWEPGQCSTDCRFSTPSPIEFGWGLGWIPIEKQPKRVSFKTPGLEMGFLLMPHSACNLDVELVALVDVLKYIPQAQVLKRVIDALNTVTSGNYHFELSAGGVGNATVGLCRSLNGRWVANHAELCLGIYGEAGIGTPKVKEDVHGAG